MIYNTGCNDRHFGGFLMLKETTLTQFIEEQLTRFEIQDTEKNRNKLRRKFIRTLEELEFWENAKTVLIERNKTKVFTPQQLQQLYNEVEPYLLKHGNIDIGELEEYRRKYDEYLEELHSMTQEDYMKLQAESQYEPPKVTQKEAMNVMVTALFEKFFEPLDIEQWNDDKAFAFFTDLMDKDSIDYFNVAKRLNNPVKYYVKPRKEQEKR